MADRLLRFALLVALTTLATPALAVVDVEGDVQPAPTSFGVLFIDEDNDFFSDVISPSGNTVNSDLADPFDPTGMSGNGLAWNDPIIWRNYESSQNILVGETGTGQLTINGGSALRYQHVVLGGVSNSFGTSMFGTSVTDSAMEFDINDARGIADEISSGYGVMTVTGFGSVFNNDPQVIESQLLTALNQTSTNFFADGSPDPGQRPLINDDGYDIYVGLSGSGEFNVTAGGQAVIQDSLVVGLGAAASGLVNVDGAGSILTVYGRSEFMGDTMQGNSDPTSEVPSIIGGEGVGLMNITGSGRASFFNGLSIGAGNSTAASIDGTGNGSVEVSGSGSTLNAFTSDAMTTSNTASGRVALAVGELRDLNDDLSVSGTLGVGRLRIETGAAVNATYNPSYDNTGGTGGNIEIGYRGTVEMRGGGLIATPATGGLGASGGTLVNDGLVNGYGLIRAANIITSTYSRIEGIDNFAGEEAVARPLQILVDNDTILGPGNFSDQAAFWNRGSIEGNIDVLIQGSMVNGSNLLTGGPNETSNGGSINATGTIRAASFLNNTEAIVRVEPGDSLSLLATGDTPASFDATGGIPVVGGGTDLAYRQLNLGSIVVDQGFLELGYLSNDDGAPYPFIDPVDMSFNTEQVFFNARFVQIDTTTMPDTVLQEDVGTITVSDGNLRVLGGVINAGVVAFVDGSSTLDGDVYNALIEYNATGDSITKGGVVLVSGADASATITGDLVNDGTVSIGSDDNVLNVLGDFTNTGELLFAIDSAGGSGHLNVQGDITLAGFSLAFSHANTEDLFLGYEVTLMKASGELNIEPGTFLFDAPTAPAGLEWIPSITGDRFGVELALAGVAPPGDANLDGVIDAIDYTIWRDTLGSTVDLRADFDGNGIVDDFDYDLWAFFYGFSPVPSLALATGSSMPVPEPSAALLAMLAVAGAACRRR